MSVFTPLERRFLHVLSDGMPHTFDELFLCMEDAHAERQTVYVHLSNIRRKLRVVGQDIVREVQTYGPKNYKRFYRHVRLLASPYS